MEAGSKTSPTSDNVNTDQPSRIREKGNDIIPSAWQEAYQRVLLYLQAFNVREEKCHQLALEALRLAISKQKNTAGQYTQEAMRAIRELLKKSSSLSLKESFRQKNVLFHEHLSEIKSMPPLNRGCMVPDKIDLIPWGTSLLSFLKKGAHVVFRPLNFLLFSIFFLIFLLLILLK